MPSRRATSSTDKRLKANRPPPKPKPIEKKTRYQQLLDGDISVHDLDDEEIRRGRCRDRQGGFSGRPPTAIPREVSDALRVEFQTRVREVFEQSVHAAQAALLEITNNRRAAAPARVRAAEVLLERSLGKVPDKIHQQVEMKKFEVALSGILVDVRVEEKKSE